MRILKLKRSERRSQHTIILDKLSILQQHRLKLQLSIQSDACFTREVAPYSRFYNCQYNLPERTSNIQSFLKNLTDDDATAAAFVPDVTADKSNREHEPVWEADEDTAPA